LRKSLKEFIGYELETFNYTIEKSKVNELVSVLNLNSTLDLNSNHFPLTFPTIIEFWGGTSSISNELNLNLEKVLHGEQEYEYFKDFSIGDEIKVTTIIEDIYEKASMNFVVVNRKFINQNNELVAIGKSTIIERF